MTRTLITNARLIDPSTDYDGPGGVLTDGEIIVDAGANVIVASAPNFLYMRNSVSFFVRTFPIREIVLALSGRMYYCPAMSA